MNPRNNNSFLDFTLKYSKFSLLEEQTAKEYLLQLINLFHNNISNIKIDYEKLIYIELTFTKNKEIQLLIKNIKENIKSNWEKEQKLLNRFK